MGSRTICTVLASLALFAAPLAAQDTTTSRRDTTGARPAPDTTSARRDSVAVIRPADSTGARKDTIAVVQPSADTTAARKDTVVVVQPSADTTAARKDTVVVVQPSADTTAARKDTVVVVQPSADTTAARKDTVAVAQPAADTTAARRDTTGAAPTPDNLVRPGMTEAEVRSRWGEPLATRTANDWTYLFYRNRRERRVGYEDVVFLQHGLVMDAIVRSPDHVYAGVSSSPEGRVPVFTPPHGQPADSAKGAAVTGVQVKPDQ